MIVTVGAYTGGEFWVEGTGKLDLRGSVRTFNGKDQHMSFPFAGERISIIWFCHTSYREVSGEQLEALEELGFILLGRQGVVPENMTDEESPLTEIVMKGC